LTDASNDIIGNAQDAYTAPTTDQYGYQPLPIRLGAKPPETAAQSSGCAGPERQRLNVPHCLLEREQVIDRSSTRPLSC
jgi:hypothetical protein